MLLKVTVQQKFVVHWSQSLKLTSRTTSLGYAWKKNNFSCIADWLKVRTSHWQPSVIRRSRRLPCSKSWRKVSVLPMISAKLLTLQTDLSKILNLTPIVLNFLFRKCFRVCWHLSRQNWRFDGSISKQRIAAVSYKTKRFFWTTRFYFWTSMRALQKQDKLNK